MRIESGSVGVDPAERLRRSWLRGLAGGAAACAGGAVAGIAAGVTWLLGLAFMGFCASAVALVGLLVATRDGRRLRAAAGAIAIEEGALVVEGPLIGRRVPLAEIETGWLEEPGSVHVALRSGEVVVAHVGLEEGQALLRAAGVTAAERLLRVPLASPAARTPGGRAFGALGLATAAPAWVFGSLVLALGLRELVTGPRPNTVAAVVGVTIALALLASLIYALFAFVRPREAVVGADGIRFRRAFKRELIPYASIEHVVRDRRGVRLERKGKPAVVLPMHGAGATLPTGRPPGTAVASPEEARRDALLHRIREAMSDRREGGPSEASLSLLDRGARSLDAWRADLAKLLGRGVTYRGAGLTAEDLGEVIADAKAPAERRIAAAIALGGVEPEEARRHVRIAVRAAADDELAIALERAAEGEIEEGLLARRRSDER